MCLNNIYELGSRLCELLSTLKKNREYVPLEILQTQYRIPYESLKKQIGDTATAFVKEITLSKLMINPDVSLEEQISVIQQAITTSGMLKWSKQDLDLHGKLLIYVKSSPPMPAATEQINNGF